jgi:uncharacterized membrane protein YccC
MSSIKSGWVRSLGKKCREADPGGYVFFTSLQVTIAGCLGAVVWGVFKPPGAFLITILSALLVMIQAMLARQRDWFILLLLTTLNLAFGQFMCSMLYQARFLLLLFIFLYTYVNFRSEKYRPIGSLIMILGTLTANSPGGWQHGVNHVINVFISFGIALLSIVLFAGLLRACLKRMLHGMTQQACLAYARVGVRLPSVNANDDEESAFERFAVLALKLNVLVNKTWYLLKADQVFQVRAGDVLHRLRILMTDHSMLRHLEEQRERLQEKIPSTAALLEDVALRMQAASDGLAAPLHYSPVRRIELYQQWQKEKDAFKPDDSEQQCRLLLFALETILEDLRAYEDSVLSFYEPIGDVALIAVGTMSCENTAEAGGRCHAEDAVNPVSAGPGRSEECRTRHSGGDTAKDGTGTAPSSKDVGNQKIQAVTRVIDSFERPRTAEQQREVQRAYSQTAFRVAVVAAFSVFLWKATHLPHGYWVLMTIGVIYCGVNQGAILQRAGYRLLGTFAGIVLAFFFVRNFLLFNFTWAYALPVVFFLMIYLYLITGNYAIMTLFITVFTGLLLSVLSGARPDFFLCGTLFNRFVCTTVAAVIVLVAELTIFPQAMRSVQALKRTWHSLIQELSDCLHVLVQHYVEQKPFTPAEWRSLNGIVEKYASTGKLHQLMRYELGVPGRYERLFKEHQQQLNQLLAGYNGLIAMVCHEKPGVLSDDEVARILQMADTISGAIQDLEHLDSENPSGPLTPSVEEEVNACITPAMRRLLFVELLEYMAGYLDNLLCKYSRTQRSAT